jgi:hypothetical protein
MNVNIKRVLFESITFSPDTVEHLLAREHAAGRFKELPENLEFLWGQISTERRTPAMGDGPINIARS